jgi:hypothetical protein
MLKANARGLYLQKYDTIVFSISQLQQIRDDEKRSIHEVGGKTLLSGT